MLRRERNQGSLPGIAIVGNMNVGKTTLFARLCGTNTTSVNFPGSTVTVTKGRIRGLDKQAIDTPGTYSVFAHNEDERVSRDVLLSLGTNETIEGTVLVADAKNLKRSLALALQYTEYGVPMLLDVNMVDEAESRGISIDYAKLSEIFGLDVCASVATEGLAVGEIRSKLGALRVPKRPMTYPDKVEEFIRIVENLLADGCHSTSLRGLALLLLAGDRSAAAHIADTYGQGMIDQLENLAREYRRQQPTPFNLLLTTLYNKKAEEIVGQVQRVAPPTRSPFIHRLGEWCTHPITGIPIALVVVYLMYVFVGSFGATLVVDALDRTVFQKFLVPLFQKLVDLIPSAFVADMIMDPDFGILPAGVFLALGLVLPVLFCFYVFFGLLEDSGYIPRMSFLLDKVFRQIGLNGKGVMPLVMGFSCITMALLTTRMLDTDKERNIASFLLMFGLPCAPLLGAMFVVLDKLPATASIAVFGTIVFQILLSGYVVDKIMPGKRSPLLMEIPPMRIPNPAVIVKRAALRTYWFMKEAVPVFVFAAFLVFVFQRAGGLAALEEALLPLTDGFLGLPQESVQVFIKTMVRRESGATELAHLHHHYSNLQLVVSLILMTFLIPCLNATIVLFKERGLKAATCITVGVVVYAILVAGTMNHMCLSLGVTFT
jgi:ferrous iron transport protein B